MPVSDEIIRCEGVSVDYRTASTTVRALSDVTVAVFPRRLTVLSGPSGSGKSTLLRVLAGLRTPTSGRVIVGTEELSAMSRRRRRAFRRHGLGVVLQDPADNLLAYLTVAEQVDLAARLRHGDGSDASSLLAGAGLTDLVERRPAQLSGGEQQRLAFAVAATGRPAVILADEPTAELDRRAAAVLVGTMRTLVAGGSTLIVTSHDHDVIAAADDVVTLRDGRLVEGVAP